MDTDVKKMFDPRKILEAKQGMLGGLQGFSYGMYGDFAQYSPKAYFVSSDLYNPLGYFDAKTVLREWSR